MGLYAAYFTREAEAKNFCQDKTLMKIAHNIEEVKKVNQRYLVKLEGDDRLLLWLSHKVSHPGLFRSYLVQDIDVL